MKSPVQEPSSGAAEPFVWPLGIDRSLGVPVNTQLRGQLEYGIACGDIPRGARLPSVRELSQELGVAHMTVAGVYKELLGLGLIMTSRGRGTFVAAAPQPPPGPDLTRLTRLLSDTLARAEGEGYSLRQIGEAMNALIARGAQPQQTGVSVLLVGLFADATRSYAANVQAALPAGDRVQAVTLDDLRSGRSHTDAQNADVVLALAHRLNETRALLPGREIIPVGFIPSQRTRAALAALDPMIRLTIVTTFEEFLPTFLSGVKRFAPHVLSIQATHLHAKDLQSVLDACDVATYATGSERVRTLIPNKPALEYRHVVDPRDIGGLVLPAVEAQRTSRKTPSHKPKKELS
ncbi:GntR family transcriptional regulator [Deinococcus detaillensis]|uniref:GntR family transcriptional regulator n=1 Tax=Deinococcus detaillensis TaxID=2592048 RepID=A0A553UNK5_9DEIO|nr:GntR family transcriptional regulator [Deinococcus detaillensis]TSA81786.1 GntR family transcriptional regulator [Deinococcus detaillensis]